jgi:hypothetical protein
LLAVTASVLAGCSHGDDKPVITAASEATSEANLRRDCADPNWKKQNLGLWYSVCRQPIHW